MFQKTANAESTAARRCVWAAMAYIVGVMIYLLGAAILQFYIMISLRRAAAQSLIPATDLWRENEWGIGQIIAPFSWAPLLVELGCAIFNTLQKKDARLGDSIHQSRA